ncbi:unnamed protein product [Mesocestoides corti]|nr:unnamed protein product [Mesocestoides corti]
MVEVTRKPPSALVEEDPSQTSIRTKFHLISGRPSSNDYLAALRRTAASKRSLLKMCTPRGNNQGPDDAEKGLNSPIDGDPKRSKAEQLVEQNATESGLPQISKNPVKSSSDGLPRQVSQPRIRNQSAPLLLGSLEDCATKSPVFPEIICDLSRIPKNRLQKLLKKEPNYHPNNAFLYYVDPVAEDKVDATLRNEAVHSLRFMHNAFFTLSAEAFCKAVNLIDRFIVKVKVKPKYMSCVASAAYYVAAKLVESTPDFGVPSPDALVRISHCGGTAADLLRMEDILKAKLGGDLDGVNAFDFLRLFASTAIVLPESTRSTTSNGLDLDLKAADVDGVPPMDAEGIQGQPLLPPQSLPESSSVKKITITKISQSRRNYDIWSAMTSRLVVALCSLEIYRFRPVTVALAVLQHFCVTEVADLARLCDVQMNDVHQCSALVEELYNVFYRDSHPISRKALVWTLSKRTLLRIGCSSPTTLDTISEDCETDKEDNLQFLFEP